MEIANYIRDGQLVGQKIRFPNKRFLVRGNLRDRPPLFGMHLWKAGGRRITVTEGEIDALSVSQIQNNKWPVVSVPNGAKGAAQAFRDNLEYLNSFDEVVICFDADDEGNRAAIECASVLKPGKAYITQLSEKFKDANGYLVAGQNEPLMNALWQAGAYRPDGILHAKDVSLEGQAVGTVWEYPWPDMTRALYGRRSGELVVHSSGSGMGKSTVFREMIYDDLFHHGDSVGVLMLEESCRDTLHDLMSLFLNKPVRKIMAARQINDNLARQGKPAIDFGIVDDLSDEEYTEARKSLIDRGLYLYDHFGSLDCETLISRMDYMVAALGVRKLYLDHLSIVVSGMETGNERKDIDVLMTRLRQFVERTDCHVDAICHLTKPSGTPFEEGGQISLRDFRGSGALYQLADGCLGYERNQQHSDPLIANTIAVRSLKDRFGGKTGIIAALRFNPDTGRLRQIEFGYDEKGNIVFDPDSDHPTQYTDVFTHESGDVSATEILV